MTAICFLFFCTLFLVMSYIESRRARSLEDFCLAGRRASGWAAGLSIAASCIGASATIGVCGLAFEAGFPAVWWLLSGAVGLALSAWLLVDRIREEKPLTLLAALQRKAGHRTVKAAGIVILAAWTGILAAQFVAMGRILSSALDISQTAGLITGAILIAAVTLLGGQRAVIRSDVCQSGIMAAGLAVLFASLFMGNGSEAGASSLKTAAEALASSPIELWNNAFGFSDWAEFMLLIGGSYLVCPMLSARFLAVRTSRDARLAAGVGIGSLAAAALLIACIGIAARAFLPEGTAADAVLPALVETRSPLFSGLFLFVMTSAVISSADSCLITAATVAAVDLGRQKSIRATRGAAIVLSVAALAAAMSGKGVLELLLAANALYVCGVVPVAFAALRSKRPLRSGLTTAAILVGSALGLLGNTAAFGLLENDADLKLALYAAGFVVAFLMAWAAGQGNRSSLQTAEAIEVR